MFDGLRFLANLIANLVTAKEILKTQVVVKIVLTKLTQTVANYYWVPLSVIYYT